MDAQRSFELIESVVIVRSRYNRLASIGVSTRDVNGDVFVSYVLKANDGKTRAEYQSVKIYIIITIKDTIIKCTSLSLDIQFNFGSLDNI